MAGLIFRRSQWRAFFPLESMASQWHQTKLLLIWAMQNECKWNFQVISRIRVLYFRWKICNQAKPNYRAFGLYPELYWHDSQLNSIKIAAIKALCTDILNKNTFKIREAARLIGTLVSCSVRMEFGPLFYKQLEIEKIAALKQSNGFFDAHIHCSPLAINDIQW